MMSPYVNAIYSILCNIFIHAPCMHAQHPKGGVGQLYDAAFE